MAKNYDKPLYEYYPTPDEAVERLLSIVPINPAWTYLEPCRGGNDSFYRYMPKGSQWAEIQSGVDYLSTAFTPVDCIITNPPFSLTIEFLTKSKKEADVVIYLQRLNYLGAVKRKQFWNENKPTSLIVLSKRPSFSGDGNTDQTDYAYYIWDKKNRLGLEDSFYFV